MRNVECRDTRREIDESELHQVLSPSAAMHLQLCAGCRSFREERTHLRELVGSLDPVNAPGDFDFRLRARLAAQAETTRSPFFLRFGVSVPATIGAALAVMLLATIVWKNQHNPTGAPAATAGAQSNNPATTSPDNKQAEGTVASSSENTTSGANVAAQTNPPILLVKPIKTSSKARNTRSTDYGETDAPSFKGVEDADISLAAPLKPMVVSMEDDRGATRTISLPPVSFGSQRLVDNRPVSQPGNRVW